MPAIPPALLESVRANKLALKAKLLPQPGREEAGKKRRGNFNVQLRKELGLFAAVRPIRNLPGLPARFQGVDILLIRETTEDLYSSIEHEIVPGVVQSIKVVTRQACERIHSFAFAHAREKGRKEVACVHKANILKQGDGLFLEAFREAAARYPEIRTREVIIDNCCMQLVSRPSQFDVLVMGNLYGDLVSDLGAGLVGGIAATLGVAVGDGLRVYESLHGGSREAIPENTSNPLPLLLPACALLEENGSPEAAQRIRTAIGTVMTEGRVRTRDLLGKATTEEMARAIIQALP